MTVLVDASCLLWRTVRLSNLWSGTIVASLAGTTVCAMTNIHYLLSRQSYYFLQNMVSGHIVLPRPPWKAH